MAKNDDRKSTCTKATRGGCSFEQLYNGECYYVCDRECLVHVTQLDTLQKAEDKLTEKIDTLFQDLRIQTGKEIKMFYIGKTFVQANQKYTKLNQLKPDSWRKGGISSRWNDHRKEEYGRDGMIVIAVITRDQVPEGAASKVKQELYTLALEQRLLHYYQITKGDERLHNETFTSGGTDKKGSAGYALYVAFSLSEDEEERNIHEQENDEVTDNVDDTVLSLCSSNQQDNMEIQHEDTVLIPEAQETMSLETRNTTEEIHQSTNTQDRCTSTDDVVFVKYSPPPPSPPPPPKRRKTKNVNDIALSILQEKQPQIQKHKNDATKARKQKSLKLNKQSKRSAVYTYK